MVTETDCCLMSMLTLNKIFILCLIQMDLNQKDVWGTRMFPLPFLTFTTLY